MTKEKNTKAVKKSKNTFAVFKAFVALMILSVSTAYTFIELAKETQGVIVVAGAAVVFFCVSAIIEVWHK